MLGKECKDYLGNVYRSQQDMCDFYGISSKLYSGRRRQGWPVEDCLLKPLRDNSCVDYLGNKYSSFNQMCEAPEPFVFQKSLDGFLLPDGIVKASLTDQPNIIRCT